MKNKTIILVITLMFIVGFNFSCSESLLETTPTDLLTTEQVINDPATVKAFFATIYRNLPIEDFNFSRGSFNIFPGNGTEYLSNWTDECAQPSTYDGSNFNGTWDEQYQSLRNINQFIFDISEAKEAIEESLFNEYLAEARFARGYTFFFFAKYFGGVPILLEPQMLDGNNEASLHVSRNKEEEVWDQVYADLSFAMENMPEDSEYGRANRFVAAAYLSRAMLYAGSIAKYGTVELDGVVGIDPNRAKDYFLKSQKAADLVIQSGRYSLYNRNPDKAMNYRDIFLNYKDNPEIILSKGFDFEATRRTHSHDLLCKLPGIGRGYSGRLGLSVAQIQKYEYLDGRPGNLEWGSEGDEILFDNPDGIFRDRDHRLEGTGILPFSEHRGMVISIQKGVRDGGQIITGTNFGQYYHPEQKIINDTPSEIRGTGQFGGVFRQSFSSVFQRKYMDIEIPEDLIGDWKSLTHWIDIRFAEILLTYAEASYELGTESSKALESVNMIRDRAGLLPWDTEQFTLENIRHEREVELAFENQLFWDLRRTRTLVERFQNFQTEYIEVFYDLDEEKYFYRTSTRGGRKTYQQRHYYNQIPQSEININPLLVQNPGY